MKKNIHCLLAAAALAFSGSAAAAESATLSVGATLQVSTCSITLGEATANLGKINWADLKPTQLNKLDSVDVDMSVNCALPSVFTMMMTSRQTGTVPVGTGAAAMTGAADTDVFSLAQGQYGAMGGFVVELADGKVDSKDASFISATSATGNTLNWAATNKLAPRALTAARGADGLPSAASNLTATLRVHGVLDARNKLNPQAVSALSNDALIVVSML